MYLILSVLWIVFSDAVVSSLFSGSPDGLHWAQTLKGWFFVSLSAALILVVIRRGDERVKAHLAEIEDSRERFRTIFDSVSDVLFILDVSDGAILDVNRRALDTYGYARDEMLSRSVEQLSSGEAPYTQAGAQALLRRAAAGETVVTPWRARTRDGLLFWLEVSIRRAILDGRDVAIVSGRDITQRRHDEEALRESEARYRSVLDNISDVYYRTDKGGSLVMFSPSGASLLGYASVEEMLGRSASSFYAHPHERDNFLATLARTGEVRDYEVTLVRKDGSPVVVSTSSAFYRDDEGEVLGVEGIFRDITTRKQAEEALRESEQRASEIFNFAPDATFVIDRQGRVIAWNRAMEEMSGVKAADMLGKGDHEYSLPIYGKRRPMLIDLVFLPDEQVRREYDFVRSVGDRVVAETTAPVRGVPTALWGVAAPLYDSRGEVVGAIESIRDVTDYKAIERTLRETRNLFNNILESMPSAIIGLDARGMVTHWNKGAGELCGQEAPKALGSPLSRVCDWLDREARPALESAQGERRLLVETVRPEDGGQPRFYDVMVYPLLTDGEQGAVLRVDDVTHKLRLEEMMVQTEKMMSVGGLAAGMAHEINNPLGGILQGVQNIRRRLSPELAANKAAAREAGVDLAAMQDYFRLRGVLEFLDSIRQSGERAARIVGNMLGFSRRSQSPGVPSSLEELLENSLELAATDYDLKKKYDFKRIEIVREYEPDMPKVPCSPMEIEQVILNLLRNAAQAMGSHPAQGAPPRLMLRLRREADMAVLEVEDNGPGMSEEVRRKAFEPFFSTKPPGEGTGLGLSVSFFIVSAHRGSIFVLSQPGQGCRFVIRLPLEAAPSASHSAD
ncbi:PAS domain S-box protein [Fundidesulfovibrio magnetotacticus]|nr:PAS domain S-box protein [Fundidesulfovibrio magnetotacticus]